MIICASPAYIARHGAPETPGSLALHRCSVFRHPVTGRALPWYLKVGEAAVLHDVVPAMSTNEEQIEIEAVLAGHVIAMLTGVTAAAHIRAGRLVPLLTAYIPDHMGVYVYYGSRTSQPARARAFIELAVERLLDSGEYFLTAKELAAAQARARKAAPRR